jgi:hypothetical protein
MILDVLVGCLRREMKPLEGSFLVRASFAMVKMSLFERRSYKDKLNNQLYLLERSLSFCTP